jgi:hypothetical protein
MTRPRAATRALVAGGILAAVGACSDVSNRTGPSQPSLEPSLQAPAQQPSAEDPVALARNVRGFGGFFIDREGAPNIYLTDARERAAAERALAPFLAARRVDASRLRVLPANFEYARLESWFDRASPEALSIPGAVFADLDEASNRLRFGVAQGAARAEVGRALATLGIPAAAVIVEQTAPIRQLATLEDRIRPVPAGAQIDFILGICSLGFNAKRLGQLSFVTASHCTWAQGGVEGTIYYQHTWLDFSGSDNTIGTEVSDPAYFSTRRGVCPRRRVCRHSDAARAAYSIADVNVGFGTIAKTTGVNTLSTAIDATQSFTITAEYPAKSFTVGSTVHKVGRTTGWTSAPVTMTCVNVNVDGTSITQLCQTLAGSELPGSPVIVGAGDSGSPVFVPVSGNSVQLAGVLWGGNAEGTLIAFSPIANVQMPSELGDLEVVAGSP